MSLDVFDVADVAVVTLRTWIDGKGEELHPVEAVSPTRYRAIITPEMPGTIWYHFIITLADGSQKRYGATDGKRGGEGCLYDWEPPSFQLTVFDPDELPSIEAVERGSIDDSFQDVFIGLLRGEVTAPVFVEAFETLRENCPTELFAQAVDLIGRDDRMNTFIRLGGVDVEQCILESEGDFDPADVMQDWQMGQAKGRLWCASLIQLLSVGMPICKDDVENVYESAIEQWAAVDPDCENVVRNATDLRFSMPLFQQGEYSLVAVNDDVIAVWRHDIDGSSCLLVNPSLRNAHDVVVPMVDECVSEVISGYGVPIVDAADAKEVPAVFADAERYAQVHLYQLGSAVLYFHGAQRLELPMEPGLGVLMHITSLPSTGDSDRFGSIGSEAYKFVDWLADAGVRYWQILPVNPTDDHGSPYAGISAFAGNARLIEEYPELDACDIDADEFAAFCERESDWLDPYASFMAIRERIGAGKVWQDWPKKYRRYNRALIERDAKLKTSAELWRRGQFVFEQRWEKLRAYANERGVQIVGDMPIYVSSDSADVWANPQIFQLGPDGRPEVVAGCPPDAFAVDGQVWGNPIYDWDALAADGYDWWLRRLERSLDLYDFVRLDHFIGFSRYFSIPAGEKATAGEYRPGPGLEFFEAAHRKFGPLPVIAEDLGSITPSVRALVAACGFPGMDIVQFVDGGDPLSGYQPRPEKIAYTGTHDNQTIVGYAESRYPDRDAHETADNLIQKVVICDAPVRVLP
ncbi:MAG: 4-alpha-glucanotransferase, partial [Eggerthellaceae bacterium]|nr:4-alpha-glucanotransferase [Eggerthellaceae bacterium]